MPAKLGKDAEYMLRNVLRKVNRDNLGDLLRKWDCLPEIDLAGKIKRDSVEEIVEKCAKKKIGYSRIADLELHYVESNFKSKTWSIWNVDKIGDTWETMEVESMQVKLQEQLELYFDVVEVNAHISGGTYWFRIHIDPVGKTKANTVYAVYCPSSPVLATANLKLNQKTFMLQAFVVVLNCHHCIEPHLTGHCVWSLIQLALKKYINNSPKELCENLPESIQTVLKRGSRKRKHDSIEENVKNLVFENLTTKKKCILKLEECFGQDELPKLEKIEYRLKTRFQGDVPDMKKDDDVFSCSITFEGSNVLEGVFNLAKCGYTSAKTPLPTLLTKLPYLSKNHFIVQEKQNTNTSRKP